MGESRFFDDHQTDKPLSDLAQRTAATLKVLATTLLVLGGIAVAGLLIAALASEETYNQADMTGTFFIMALVVAFNTALWWAFLTLGGVLAQYVSLRTKPMTGAGETEDPSPSDQSAQSVAPAAPASPEQPSGSLLRMSRGVV